MNSYIKNFFIKNIFLIGVFTSMVFLVVCVFGCYQYFDNKNKKVETSKNESYHTVGIGNVSSNIKVLGETNLLSEQKLKFNIDGTINKIYVTEGQKVKSGDILAELDKGGMENDKKEAMIAYENAQINLEKIKERISGEDIIKDNIALQAQERKKLLLQKEYEILKADNLHKAQLKELELKKMELAAEKGAKDVDINKNKLSADLNDQERELIYKKTVLSNEKTNIKLSIKDEERSVDIKVQEYYKTILDAYEAINNDIVNSYDALRDINSILYVDREYSSIQGNIYLSAKNSSYKNSADVAYGKTKLSIQELQKKYSEKNKDSLTTTYIIELLNLKKTVFDNLYILGDFAAKAVDNSVESESLTATQISALKTTASSVRSTAYTGKEAVSSTVQKIQGLDNPESIKEKSRIAIEKLQKATTDLDVTLEKTQRDYDNLVKTFPEQSKELVLTQEKAIKDLEGARKELEDLLYLNSVSEESKSIEIKNLVAEYTIAQKNFSKKYADLEKNEEVILASNALKQAQISIDQVYEKIMNYEIRASFDGTIGAITMKAGDKISNTSGNTDEKYIYVLNPNLMEIQIKLDQINITKVAKGMEASVTFDSYSGVIFTGSLETIDFKPTNENGTKKYQAKIMINKGDLNIFSGMNAHVDIVLEKKENVIVVPSVSIETNASGSSYVSKIVNGSKIQQKVEVGIQGSENTEIINGLTTGDQILTIDFAANPYQSEDFKQKS